MDLSVLPIIGALILSIVIHEVAHGFMANWLGDPTARLKGRLTLNPISHIDPVGSVIMPGALILMGAPFLFGYAKPVPYNPYNLRNQRWGEALVAFAGPGVNLLIAALLAILFHIGVAMDMSTEFLVFLGHVVGMNIFLAVFNLIPIPPADGSKVIEPFLPLPLRLKYHEWGERLGLMGLLLLFAVVILFPQPIHFLVMSLKVLFLGLF